MREAVARVDAVYGRVSLRALYGGVVREILLSYPGEPPADPSPLPVMAGPRLPLAGPGRAAVVEVEVSSAPGAAALPAPVGCLAACSV